jgi:RimJ/RimL family protein N-acetyltransferase
VNNIRRLHPDDASALIALRREALESDPLAFAASVEDDRVLSLEFVRAGLANDHAQAVFGHFEGVHLTGMVGVIRESRVKQRHMATIWGMYVTHRARSGGIGRALLEAAIAHATGWPGLHQVQLGVSETALHAKALYESAGFRSWGRQPRALHWNGCFADEDHLVLELHDPRGS